MEDKSLFNSKQSQGISDSLQSFIDSMVEEIVLEGKPFDTQKKYLKKFCENEGLDPEALESYLEDFFDVMEEWGEMHLKSSKLMAKMLAQNCYISNSLLRTLLSETTKPLSKSARNTRVINDASIKENANTEKLEKKPESSEDGQDALVNDALLTFCIDDVEFNMIYVEGDSCNLGEQAKEDINNNNDEECLHPIPYNNYYIGETEVTQALWMTVMEKNPSYLGGEELPVEQISWIDCQDFLRKLSKITHLNFRLPTEAEWEFAACGGSKSMNCEYSGSNKLDEVAWYNGNSNDSTHSVGLKKANELGIYDMSGNVWEWCEDWYDNDSNSCSDDVNPDMKEKVIRGGSWYSGASCCLAISRNKCEPGRGRFDIGLRLVLDVPVRSSFRGMYGRKISSGMSVESDDIFDNMPGGNNLKD